MAVCHELYYVPAFFSHEENGNDDASMLQAFVRAYLILSEAAFRDATTVDIPN
jgi:hypothetical protein